MSTMAAPDDLPPAVHQQVVACTHCEHMRRPRMFVCTYHEGWWDGYDAAQIVAEEDEGGEGRGGGDGTTSGR